MNETRFVYSTQGVEETRAKTDGLAKAQGGLAKAGDAAAASNERVERRVRTLAEAQANFQRRTEAAIQQQQAMAAANDATARSAVQAAVAAQNAAAERESASRREESVLRAAGKLAIEHPLLVAAGATASARALAGLATSAATSLGSASQATARYANDNQAMGRSVVTAANLASRGLGVAEVAATTAASGLGRFADGATSLISRTGLLGRALGVVSPLLGPIALAFAAFDVGSAAIRKAGDDLDKLIALGKRAEQLDVSGPFLKQFTGVGAALGLEVDAINAAIQRASAFTREKFGESNGLSKAFADVEAGGATGLSSRVKEQAELAKTTEERIRLALAGMSDLEASGQRLAALKIGDAVFGPDFTDRLRRGETSVAQIVADLDKASGREVLRQDDVTRAVALAREIESVKREIGQAMETTFDFSKAALGLKDVWLSILKPVRDVTTAIADSLSGGDTATLRVIEGLQARAKSIQDVSIPRAESRGQSDIVANLREQVDGLQSEIDRLSRTMSSAVDQINSDVGRIPPAAGYVSDGLQAMFNAAENAARGLLGTAGAAQATGAALDNAAIKARGFADALNAIQAANPALSGTLSLMGKIGDVNKTVLEGTKSIRDEFAAGKIGDAEAQTRITKLNDEAATSIKALRGEAEKPIASYIRDAEIGKLDALGQNLARAGDRFAEARQKAADYYQVQIDRASPEARGALEVERTKRLGEMDAAYKQVQATARNDDAEKGAKAAGKAAKDAAREFETFRDKAAEAYKVTNPADALRKQGEALQKELDQYRDQLSKTNPEYIPSMEARIKLNLDGKELETVKTKTDDLSKEMTRAFSGVFDDMFSNAGKGMSGFFDSFTKGFARVGTRGIEQSLLKPLFEGGANGSGSGGSSFNFDRLGKAIEIGSEKGFSAGWEELTKPRAGATSGGSARSGGFASSALGGALSSGLAGASIGYQSQSPLIGAAGGALAGFAVAGPVGALVGGVAGLAGGMSSSSKAKAERKKAIQAQLKQYADEYEQAKSQIAAIERTFRGEATGRVGGMVDAAQEQARSAAVTASKGGDQARADSIIRDFEAYHARLAAIFVRSIDGTTGEMNRGFGVGGPFTQAVDAVAALGESLKGFVKDVGTYTTADPATLQRAQAAAREAALASLDTAKAVSTVEGEMQRIQGTATGLGQVLRDLGMSADDAATAIRERTAKAMDALRVAFDRDVATKLNEATGKGYLNEASDLLKEIATLSADRALVGGDAGQVEAYLRAAGQKIVDEAELTGAAFDDLVTRFPTLQGKVVEFSAALDTAAAKAAAATRALGFQDRLFAAGNDASTLEGQLAAYDRQARREREEEVKAGGEAIADLEAAQLAERLKIVRDYNQAAAESTRQTMEQAKSAYDTFARSIRDFVDGLSAGPNSTLSPAARLAAAQSTYSARLTGAKTGNRDDLDGITGNASDLLDAARDYYGSSAGYQGVLNAVKTQLTALPKQVSAEQFIVNAIDASKATLKAAIEANSPTLISDALTINFDALDTTLDGLLDVAEFKAGLGPLATKAEQDAAELLFKAIDTNGDGLLTKTELMRGQLLTALAANSPALIATALNTNFTKLDTSVNGLLDYAEFTAGLGPLATKAEQDAAEALFKSIDENSDGMLSALELLRTVLKTAIEANSPAALATALTANFDKLDTSVNGQLDYNELTFAIGHLATVKEQADARRIFDAIDANGDGQLDKLELVRARAAGIEVQTEATKTASESANTIANQQKAILDAQSVLLKSLETIGTQQSTFLDAIKTLTTSQEATLRAMNTMAGTQKDQLIALNNQFRTDPVFLNGTPLQNNMVTALNKIVYNTANTVIAVKNNNFGSVAYASGGLVTGPGTGTSDSIQSRLSNGEFVLTAEATRRIGVSTLNAMNDNRGFDLPAVAMPVPMSLPMPVGGGSNNAALIAEIRALREEVAALRAEQRDGNDIAEAGHLQTIGAVKGTTAAVEDGNRTASRQQLRKTG
ncbi:EF-hand domain-containing protein [Methylobacterium sp. Leaf108]|uniref:EF-hand domain-containing protein n=1 Tax=Methylobacterium sp. Leaf108 TaxID=1736256 RepID=UPI001AEC1A85|nr:EF-hand domain-containing protein [Methylobacterium sp. Leaf108]